MEVCWWVETQCGVVYPQRTVAITTRVWGVRVHSMLLYGGHCLELWSRHGVVRRRDREGSGVCRDVVVQFRGKGRGLGRGGGVMESNGLQRETSCSCGGLLELRNNNWWWSHLETWI